MAAALGTRLSPTQAKALTRQFTPRTHVRVADVDPTTNRAVNNYRHEVEVEGRDFETLDPGVPWAVHLADAAGRFRLLGFDLDAGKGPVLADLGRLTELLTRAGIAHVVCASGPGGGRHVWAALSEPATADTVAELASRLSTHLPSLDTAPLRNARTGALRPPGAPHRLGGSSTVLSGDLDDLWTPRTTTAMLDALLTQLADLPARRSAGTALPPLVARDDTGHLFLPGQQRLLPEVSLASLRSAVVGADASAVLASILAGAARSRWRYADVAGLVEQPGMEHVRTESTGPGRARRKRSLVERRTVLERQWERAVLFVATTPATEGRDGEWPARCAEVVRAVRTLQSRADAAAGRWAQGGGRADRRVLDVVCVQAVAAVALDLELDVRRLGMATGLSRETARVALHRLAADGWVLATGVSAGVRAARWAVPSADPDLSLVATDPPEPPAAPSTVAVVLDLSQAVPRPVFPGSSPQLPPPAAQEDWDAQLAAWRSHLQQRTDLVVADVFTTAGVGLHAAAAAQLLASGSCDVWEATAALGLSVEATLRHLDLLAHQGLAMVDISGRWATGGVSPAAAAAAMGVSGVLKDRAERYAFERLVWAWWESELAWRSLPRSAKKGRPLGAGQVALPLSVAMTPRQRYGRYPVTAAGRSDHRAAARLLRQLTPASVPTRSPAEAA